LLFKTYQKATRPPSTIGVLLPGPVESATKGVGVGDLAELVRGLSRRRHRRALARVVDEHVDMAELDLFVDHV
jgi:hypothetical protein